MSGDLTSKEQVADQFLEQADADAGKLSFEKPHPRDYGGVIMDCAKGPRWCLPDASRRELFYRALADYWRYRAVAADEPPAVDVAPIAKLTVRDGLVQRAGLYAPGLPDGDHDVFPVPISPKGELRPHVLAEPPSDGWIAVTERLPAFTEDRSVHVLVYSETHDWMGTQFAVMRAADFYDYDPDGDGEGGTDDSRCVTHWRPLEVPAVRGLSLTKSERCKHGTIIIPPAVCKQCRDAGETGEGL